MSEKDKNLQQVVTTKGVVMTSKVTPVEEAYGGADRVPKGVEGQFMYERPGQSPLIAKPIAARGFSDQDQSVADDMASTLPDKIKERGAYRTTLDSYANALSMRNGLPPAMNEAAVIASYERQHGETPYQTLNDHRREKDVNGLAEQNGQSPKPKRGMDHEQA